MHAPKVSVLLVTYNQESFLEKALDGVLMQEVAGGFEVVVGDDFSSDGTGQILKKYSDRNRERIRILPRTTKLGTRRNWLDTYENCRGKYIAYLDGDDYWTSPHKVQQQVALLDACPELSMCFHRAEVVDEERGRLGTLPHGTPTPVLALDALSKENFIAKSTVIVRRGLIQPVPEFLVHLKIGDWALHVLHAMHGDIGYIDETMAVYRTHRGGMYDAARADVVVDLLAKNEVCRALANHVGGAHAASFQREIGRRSLQVVDALLERRDYKFAKQCIDASSSDAQWTLMRASRMLLQSARCSFPVFNECSIRGHAVIDRARRGRVPFGRLVRLAKKTVRGGAA
jgi:glycosyltransferase involved in cell wall biosynthesis